MELIPAISVCQVSKKFAGSCALDGVSFDVRVGELHAVMGENGAGKSTLMKILSGVITDYEGQLLRNGEPIRFRGTRDAEMAGISIIHQELNLVEQLSIAANIFLGREKSHGLGVLNQREMDRQAGQLLAKLDCSLSPRELVSSLRVGDQQLVEIAKALSVGTSVLIMDEPTSALTESEVERLYRVIEQLRGQGVTILYISHKMDEVFRLADRITVLRDGKWVTTVAKAETNPKQVAHWMVGRTIDDYRPGSRVMGEVVLKVKDLSLQWPGHARPWRLRNIGFQLHAGEILGIAGLMGAGRTELLESLFGTSPVPAAGEVFLNGVVRRFSHAAEAMQAGMAMVTEDRKRSGLFSQMSVKDNITLCALPQVSRASVISASAEWQLCQSQIARLQVKTDGPWAAITSLSGGNQQKCIIARCLLVRPSVLLLDDPTRGIDVGAKAELYALMNQLAAEGMAILVTSSELPELLTLSDRILVLREGEIVAEMSRAEATEQRIMEAATGSN